MLYFNVQVCFLLYFLRWFFYLIPPPLGKSIPEMTTCISWMIPFALAIKNEGLDFVNRLPLDGTTTTLQTHTISLELLVSCRSVLLARIETNLSSLVAKCT